MKILGASYKTSAVGWSVILGSLGVILSNVALALDADPLTVPNWQLVIVSAITAATGLGNVFSRDEHVSTEEANKSKEG